MRLIIKVIKVMEVVILAQLWRQPAADTLIRMGDVLAWKAPASRHSYVCGSCHAIILKLTAMPLCYEEQALQGVAACRDKMFLPQKRGFNSMEWDSADRSQGDAAKYP